MTEASDQTPIRFPDDTYLFLSTMLTVVVVSRLYFGSFVYFEDLPIWFQVPYIVMVVAFLGRSGPQIIKAFLKVIRANRTHSVSAIPSCAISFAIQTIRLFKLPTHLAQKHWWFPFWYYGAWLLTFILTTIEATLR